MPFVNMYRFGDGAWSTGGGRSLVTVFKTYRNARGKGSAEFLRTRGVNRRVFWFDLKYLPEVLDEDDIPPLVMDQMTELEHAERQVELWAKRYEELSKQEGPPCRVGSNVQPDDDGKRRKPRKRREVMRLEADDPDEDIEIVSDTGFSNVNPTGWGRSTVR